MDGLTAQKHLRNILSEIQLSNGLAATEQFSGLREVDAKVREVKLLFETLPGGAKRLLSEMDSDDDFRANSRRVRLESLANYCKTALRYIDTDVVQQSTKKILHRCPDISRLTTVVPDLEKIISTRWLEAQKCQHAGSYLAAVIVMGSILEGLLLCKTHQNPIQANRSTRTPKDKRGKPIPVQDWSLSSLIDVATDLDWLKSDRGKFSHALRESRNIVHPWAQAMQKSDFDKATCLTSWEVLKASVDDLLR